MEGLSKTGNNVNWIINGHTLLNTIGDTTANMLGPTMIIFSAVCDWNLRLMASYEPFPNQIYATQIAFNI